MINGFYSAKLGMLSHQEYLNVISNNLANVNTVGYKPIRVSFTDLMYQNINRMSSDNEAMIGHGVKINGTDVSMTQGPLETTNYALDFALLEEGIFFAVQDGADNIYYTRAGNFILSTDDGDTFYLATQSGNRVLGPDLDEIEVVMDEDGYLDLELEDIGVFRFTNPYGLSLAGDGLYTETEASGEPVEVEEPAIRNGYLEGSGVEVSNEMVNMIEASRAFSFNSRMIQVADEVEQIVNGLR